MRFFNNTSVGFKICGMAAGILAILVAVTIGNNYYMTQVNDDMVDIAHYITPLENHVAEVDMYALEQEIHFERILRLYEIKPLDDEKISLEMERYDYFGDLVDKEIEKTISISEEALRTSHIIYDLIEFARLEPMLIMLEQDHQGFHDQALEIIKLKKNNEIKKFQLFDKKFEESKDIFNKRVYELLLGLEHFTVHTIHQIMLHEQKLLKYNQILTIIATIFGVFLAIAIILHLMRPVKELIHAAKEFDEGNYNISVNFKSKNEVGKLAQSFNTMVSGVRQREYLREAFGQYIDPRIMELVLKNRQEPVQNTKQVVTMFFSDLAKFSTISEMLTPVGLVNLINEYFTLATEPITNYQGVIDKFIGDAIIAFWGPPFVSEKEQAKFACRAALEQFTQLAKLQLGLAEIIGIRKGLPKIDIRIGLDTGELVMGSVGAQHSRSFTVIGPPVKRAEHLEGANKIYGTNILMSESTTKLAGDYIETRMIDWLPLGDKGENIAVYELVGIAGSVDEKVLELNAIFEQGVSAFQENNLDKACTLFESCLKLNHDDAPSKYYVNRITSTTSSQNMGR